MENIRNMQIFKKSQDEIEKERILDEQIQAYAKRKAIKDAKEVIRKLLDEERS